MKQHVIGQSIADKYGITLDELRTRIREMRQVRLADPNTCDWCDEALPESVFMRRGRWCSTTCRQRGNAHPDLVT